MKIRTRLFRFVVAITTFTVGAGLFAVWQNVNSAPETVDPEIVALQPMSPPETVSLPPAATEIPTAETTSEPVSNQNADYTFDATGDYYLADEKAPKNFKDFEAISIITHDYIDSSDENGYQAVPIPPKGAVLTNVEFKFSRINIGNRQIALETEIKRGISYKFAGKFVDGEQRPDGVYVDLEGRLTKMRNGKKIAESDIRLLVSCGC